MSAPSVDQPGAVSSGAPDYKTNTLSVVLQAAWTALHTGPDAFTELASSSRPVVDMPATPSLITLALNTALQKDPGGHSTAQRSEVLGCYSQQGGLTDPGKGPLLLGLAVGLGLKLGHHPPAPRQCLLCCLNTLPFPHLHQCQCSPKTSE